MCVESSYIDLLYIPHYRPTIDLMKISSNTFQIVESNEWRIPTLSETFQMKLHNEEKQLQWERVLRIGLVPGLAYEDDEEFELDVESIIQTVQQMGNEVASRDDAKRQLFEAQNMTEDDSISISEAFSLTSLEFGQADKSSRRLERFLGAGRDWSRSLQRGLEAHHSCESMFEQMEIKSDVGMKQFDIILNPRLEYDAMNGFEKSDSSASNVDCVKSLIVGISVHPHVLTIGAELPVTPDDYESQWISQSNTWGSTPLYDKGL